MLRSTARRVLSNTRSWDSSNLGTIRRVVARSLASNDDQHSISRRSFSTAFSTSWKNVRSGAFNNSSGGSFLNRGSASLLVPNNSFPPKRQMSSSSSPDDVGATNLPSFGSSPITPDNIESATEFIAKADPFVATWWPSDQCLLLLNYVHETTGLPYAVTIGATTLAFRVLLFPLFVKGQRNSSRMAHLQPELAAIKDRLEAKTDPQAQQRYIAQTRALFTKYDCNPVVGLMAPLATFPFFISMFFALKNAPDYFPQLLSTGGMFWFPDLTAADPYMIMPLYSAATFLAMSELGKEALMASDPARGRVMTNAFRAMAIVMVPITMNFNAGIFVYWSVNNTFSVLQTALLKQDAVKKSFGIWDPPKPVPGKEVGSIMDDVKKLMSKKEEETNALAAEKIREHNEIVERQKKVRKALKEKEDAKKRLG